VADARRRGAAASDAVDEGLVETGAVISWAGVIMAVAFCGFLFSGIPLLNQLGFFIVSAVLVFVFVVRPLLAPALLHALGDAAWWSAPPGGAAQQHAAAAAEEDGGAEKAENGVV
jgi:uncharacterized membrane protein YdfJ with MMPL/SSD domain